MSANPFADHFASFAAALDALQSKTSVLAAFAEVGNPIEGVREEARVARVRVLALYNEALTGWQTGAPSVTTPSPLDALRVLLDAYDNKPHHQGTRAWLDALAQARKTVGEADKRLDTTLVL